MISLQIITDHKALANEITNYLLNEKLILEAIIHEKVTSKVLQKGTVISSDKVLISGITKALLFTKINQELEKKFNKQNFTTHSVPIVYMDWERQNKLLQQVENI